MGQPETDVQLDLHDDPADGSAEECFDDVIRRKVAQAIARMDNDPVLCQRELHRRVMEWLSG
jgi:hypothetical protein